jgi:hypothetical protein
VRELRSELLMKLALPDRRGADPAALSAAQRAVVEEIVAGLAGVALCVEGFAVIVHAWRLSTARGAQQLLGEASLIAGDAALLAVIRCDRSAVRRHAAADEEGRRASRDWHGVRRVGTTRCAPAVARR